MAKWPSISARGNISNDGKYVSYVIGNLPEGSRLVILSTKNGWKREFVMAYSEFTADSKKCAVYKSDSLLILTLGTELIEKIPT